MVLLEFCRSDAPIDWHYQDFTIAEILSDSIVKAMMQADGVDPKALEAQLRSLAQAMPANGSEEVDRLVLCRASPTLTPAMFD